MMRKSIILTTMALLTTQTVFAHDSRDYYDPIVVVSLVAFSVLGTMLFWAILARNKGWSKREEMTMILLGMAAFVHLYIGIDSEWLLLLNGAGYLLLTLLLYLPIAALKPYRRHLMLVTVGYTAITFIGYYALHGINLGLLWDWTGVFAKLIELGVLVLMGQSLLAGDSGMVSAD